MITKAVRLHTANQLSMDEFCLPEITENEIRAKVISDSMCMSSYKALKMGERYFRVPENVSERPIMIGHEFCAIIEEVGKKWKNQYVPGEKIVVNPTISGQTEAPGFSYPYIGGCSQYIIIPDEVIASGNVLQYKGKTSFFGSLAEPLGCIAHAFHSHYHLNEQSIDHVMGIREGGNLAILAGAGPMGLAAIDYALHNDRKPGLLVVTDINQERLDRAASIYTVEDAAKNKIRLVYVNTAEEGMEEYLMELTRKKGYDDILVFAPVPSVIELADRMLAFDGCMDFFSGPSDCELSANINFYKVHYEAHHYVGTTGGRLQDSQEVLKLAEKGRLNPAGLVTHIGGLDCVADTLMILPQIPGGKKLIYPQIKLPLTSIEDFEERGKTNELFRVLHRICKEHNNLWNKEAEEYLLEKAEQI